MKDTTLIHDVNFIEKFKPSQHPLDKHLLMIDMNHLVGSDWQDICETLTEMGIRFHLQNNHDHCMLCLDKAAFEIMQMQAEALPAQTPAKIAALH